MNWTAKNIHQESLNERGGFDPPLENPSEDRLRESIQGLNVARDQYDSAMKRHNETLLRTNQTA